jgi:hypothetical protein
MVCGKCKHNFCWHCLGPYYHYTHSEERYCPSRNSVLVISVLLIIFLLNQKLFYFSSYFYAFEFYMFMGFFGCALADLAVFSLIVYMPLGATVIYSNSY